MSTFSEKLRAYFETSQKTKILRDWESTAEFDGVGLTLDEFLLGTSYNWSPSQSFDIGSSNIENKFSPEFSSGFFITNKIFPYAKRTRSRFLFN